jgi:hypothetical protein
MMSFVFLISLWLGFSGTGWDRKEQKLDYSRVRWSANKKDSKSS